MMSGVSELPAFGRLSTPDVNTEHMAEGSTLVSSQIPNYSPAIVNKSILAEHLCKSNLTKLNHFHILGASAGIGACQSSSCKICVE